MIENNVFEGNTAAYTGGGPENLSGNPTIQNNIFINNAFFDIPTPDYQLGGGLYSAWGDPQIRNNIFANNAARSGGGLFIAGGSPAADHNDGAGSQPEGRRGRSEAGLPGRGVDEP